MPSSRNALATSLRPLSATSVTLSPVCALLTARCTPELERVQAELGAREYKRRRVEQDRAHAALVFDGDVAVAWAEYGPVEELPNIHHRKQWEAESVRRPDYRITCLFVGRGRR